MNLKIAKGGKIVEKDLVPLTEMMEGEEGTVHSILGGHGLIGRLASMGIFPGARIKVFRKGWWGPVIVIAEGTKIAVGRGQASRIMVLREGDKG